MARTSSTISSWSKRARTNSACVDVVAQYEYPGTCGVGSTPLTDVVVSSRDGWSVVETENGIKRAKGSTASRGRQMIIVSVVYRRWCCRWPCPRRQGPHSPYESVIVPTSSERSIRLLSLTARVDAVGDRTLLKTGGTAKTHITEDRYQGPCKSSPNGRGRLIARPGQRLCNVLVDRIRNQGGRAVLDRS